MRSLRQCCKSAIDPGWHNTDAAITHNTANAVLEMLHLAVPGTCALGEDQQALSLLQQVFCVGQTGKAGGLLTLKRKSIEEESYERRQPAPRKEVVGSGGDTHTET